MFLAKIFTLVILFDTISKIGIVAQQRFSTNHIPSIVNIVSHGRLYEEGVVIIKEIYKTPESWNDLWYTYRRLFKVTQTESLSIASVDTHIRNVVQNIGLLIRHLLRPIHDYYMFHAFFKRNVSLFKLPFEQFQEVPCALYSCSDYHFNWLSPMPANDFSKSLHARIPPFPWLISVQIQNEEIILVHVEILSGYIFSNWEISIFIDTMC